ncbi:MAG: DUF3458 domain-containing protein, partial [Rhabdaerophilum sp.]
WTGNRITCRDWFQLCLKEGLTVFRDQEFSSDQRSRAVERIANVQTLRAAQFVEDAGPLAHPVRPQTYKEINNFYTATVYNKGSELIQMIRLLIGPETFRAGMDLYFGRHDGEAAVVEQFIQCFADVSGRDFAPFMRWYDQAGTPVVTVTSEHDRATGRYTLHFRQETQPTPGQPDKHPQVIPIRLGLIGEDGTELAPDDVFVLDGATGSRSFTGLARRPIPSLFRGFSAPVKVVIERKDGDLLTLARHDVDPFNRWQALQDAATDLLRRSVRAIGEGKAPLDSGRLAEAVASLIAGSQQDRAFAGFALGLPTDGDLARVIATDIDPDAIGLAIDHLRRAMGRLVREPASRAYETLSLPVPFSPDGTSAGRRALRAQLLRYIVAAEPEGGARMALHQYERADNMTDRVAALTALLPCEGQERETALAAFEKTYGEDALILDMWFGLQARVPGPGSVARVRALTGHPKFTLANPNRARALIATFANGNLRGFHAADGSGYQLVAEIIDALDARNPQIAARMATAFRTWRNLEGGRRDKAGAVLRNLAGKAKLSRDLGDILERTLS